MPSQGAFKILNFGFQFGKFVVNLKNEKEASLEKMLINLKLIPSDRSVRLKHVA